MNGEESRPAIRITPRLILGLTIMAVGILLALETLGLVDAGAFFRYWPLALVAVGIVKLLAPSGPTSAGLFWIIAGACLLAFNFGLLTWQRLWAFLFLVVGGSIAWRALRPVAPRVDPTSGIDIMALLAGTRAVSNAADFKGGQALAIMGGCEVDLRHATIAQGEAVVDVFAFWGGIQIRVPEEWEVINRGNAFLGGFEDKTRLVPGTRQRLIITGTAIMGGVEVKN